MPTARFRFLRFLFSGRVQQRDAKIDVARHPVGIEPDDLFKSLDSVGVLELLHQPDTVEIGMRRGNGVGFGRRWGRFS